MIPSYGESLIDNKELANKVREHTIATLKLNNTEGSRLRSTAPKKAHLGGIYSPLHELIPSHYLET